MKDKFDITGMTCSACSAHVEKSVGKLTGVDTVQVSLLQNTMQVEYDKEKLSEKEIIQAVEKGGYGAKKAGEKESKETGENPAKQEMEKMEKRLISSFCFLVPLFYISMGKMLGMPLPPLLLGHENVMIFALTQLLLTLPIVVINQKYFVVGFRSLFHLAPNMDSLIALGATASLGYSIFSIYAMGYLMGHGNSMGVHKYAMELYFESAGMILTLITLGKYLESRSKGKTSEAIRKLLDLAPKTARVLRNGVEEVVGVEDVIVGEILVVRSGESIPLDGKIIEGSCAVDEAAITGESIPVEKQIGDMVIGATMNRSGYMKMEVTKVGKDTTLAQIIHLVEEAGASKAPISKLADKVSGVFVPVVMAIAILAAVIWLFLGYSFGFALSIGIAVLVISCPCALGLATPTAIMVGTGKGAEEGILMKSAESLELLHQVNVVVLDKTGTVTEGKPKVTDVVLAVGVKEETLLQQAGAVEKMSEHPLSKAIVEWTEEKGIPLFVATDFVATAGRGIQGKTKNGLVYIGNEKIMTEKGFSNELLFQKGERFAEEGKTPLYVAQEDKGFLGIFAVADVIKKSSQEAISLMEKMGKEVIMLTGDNKRTAEAIRKQLGIASVIAEVLPQDKEKEIRRLQKMGKKVAMVGDGINDAPALARADVGIAIGTGTEIAIESADVVLMRSDLLDVVGAMELSKKVLVNIKENLFWAFFYNICGIPLAAGAFYSTFGWKLSPMFGAAAMSVSSLFVVSNALRLRFFKPSYNKKMVKTEKHIEEKTEKKEVFQMEKKMVIEGMMCGHCTGRVEKALNEMDGVTATVSLDEKTATVTLAKEVSDAELTKTVIDAGYQVVKIQ